MKLLPGRTYASVQQRTQPIRRRRIAQNDFSENTILNSEEENVASNIHLKIVVSGESGRSISVLISEKTKRRLNRLKNYEKSESSIGSILIPLEQPKRKRDDVVDSMIENPREPSSENKEPRERSFIRARELEEFSDDNSLRVDPRFANETVVKMLRQTGVSDSRIVQIIIKTHQERD